ncbi:uncharacterized protein LOC116611993 isoform X1 [Nematostella vectensis]|uniref:uncharacterized protein LOC116611993 isoform X1 n=1 Tax=Nematostella vectensis TaxID=45351 RepID=UPI002076D983|nr:uncharacterized protein LOC116611993 isoform X1 [Nematostella vectensis]
MHVRFNMAAISARCLRSFAKAASMSRSAASVGGMSKSGAISSLVSRSLPVLKDSSLLQKIARDNMAKNLARRHSKLSAAVSVICQSPPLLLSVDSDGESAEGLLVDDDETFSCLDDDAIHGL